MINKPRSKAQARLQLNRGIGRAQDQYFSDIETALGSDVDPQLLELMRSLHARESIKNTTSGAYSISENQSPQKKNKGKWHLERVKATPEEIAQQQLQARIASFSGELGSGSTADQLIPRKDNLEYSSELIHFLSNYVDTTSTNKIASSGLSGERGGLKRNTPEENAHFISNMRDIDGGYDRLYGNPIFNVDYEAGHIKPFDISGDNSVTNLRMQDASSNHAMGKYLGTEGALRNLPKMQSLLDTLKTLNPNKYN